MVPVLSSWLAMEIEFFLAVFANFSISWVVSLSRSERLSTKDKKSIFARPVRSKNCERGWSSRIFLRIEGRWLLKARKCISPFEIQSTTSSPAAKLKVSNRK